jgi:outer membrane protein OmpA-like peptidoglycan-associated protein
VKCATNNYRFFLTLTVLFFGLMYSHSSNGQTINNYLSEAKKQRAKLDYPIAIDMFQEALALEPTNATALEGLIEIYLYRYEIYDSAEVYLLKRINSMVLDTNVLVFYDYARCLQMQERHYEAIEKYLDFKTNYLVGKKFNYINDELNERLETSRYAIKNKSIVNDNATFTVENMDFYINSVDPEYTPIFLEKDSILLFNARYKDFENEDVSEDSKYFENIYYFNLIESVSSSYNPGIEQDNHHAVVAKRSDNDDILVFYLNKIWTSSIAQDRLNELTELPEIFGKYYFQPHGVFANNGKTFIFSAMERPEFDGGDLNIYISELIDTTWSTPKPISPVINSEKNEDSPFLSADGKTLYFSSKGHNSSGGYDFYKSELKNGEWTYPENLGYPMNSAGDDIYLSFTDDGKTGFFSSNRNGGFGGMDIYTFTVDQKLISGITYDKTGKVLADVVVTLTNLTDKTIVTTQSDANGAFQFKVDSDQEFELLGQKEKYFDGKNTAHTKLIDDEVIANLTLEKDPGISLYALITDKKTSQSLDSVKMTITDNMTGLTETFLTGPTGDYRKAVADKKLSERGSYNFTLEREGYLSKTLTYNIVFDKEGTYNVHADLDISLEKIEVGEDLSKIIDIKPIYFDVNKSDIRPDAAVELDKIVKVMNENPNMMVELGSHTDSRGSATSNASLSERRAQASAAYIKARITNPERITGKGYGETRLFNECADGVECSKEKHQENRRTEFIIVRL